MKKIIFIIAIFLSLNIQGQVWSPLGNGVNQIVFTLTSDTINNLLHLGGRFDSAGTGEASYLASWDGTNLSYVGATPNDIVFSGFVYASIMYESKLYIGGWMTGIASLIVNSIANWDGNNWNALGAGIGALSLECGTTKIVHDLVTYNNNLIVCGEFRMVNSDTVNHIARWDGMNWYSFGSGMDKCVSALGVYHNELYVSGYFNIVDGNPINYMAKWDGTIWSSANYTAGTTYDLLVYKDELYTGDWGGLAKLDTITNEWVWVAIVKGINPIIQTLEVFNNELVVGGSFDTINGIPAKNIAKFDGVNWSTLGTGTNADGGGGIVEALAVLNGSLYAGGWFTEAGGVPARYIARWGDTITTSIKEESNLENNVIIYPNPNPGQFTLKIDNINNQNLSLNLYRIDGKLTLSHDFKNISGNYNQQINLSEYAKGIYYVQIVSDRSVVTKKVIYQ